MKKFTSDLVKKYGLDLLIRGCREKYLGKDIKLRDGLELNGLPDYMEDGVDTSSDAKDNFNMYAVGSCEKIDLISILTFKDVRGEVIIVDNEGQVYAGMPFVNYYSNEVAIIMPTCAISIDVSHYEKIPFDDIESAYTITSVFNTALPSPE